MSLKLLIIDDESKTRGLLHKMLEGFKLDLHIYSNADSKKSGLKAIKNINPDIVLLDIQMPDGSGFDLLEETETKEFEVIFITAHEQYAIRAIKSVALDYILKPVDPEELEEAINKAITNINDKNNAASLTVGSNGANANKKLVLKTQDAVFLIDIDEVVRCEADRNYTTFYLKDGRSIVTSKTLKEYVMLASSTNFFRCHRSHLINLNYFDRYKRIDGGYIIMKDESEIPLARSAKDHFFKFLETL